MTVALKPVKSSNIHSVGHDPVTKELHVKFKEDGPTYVYSGVTSGEYVSLTGADSVGKHFAANIKGSHPVKKVE